MTGFRIEVVAHCYCDEGNHDAVAFRTVTPGLVVAEWVHQPGREGRWAILHHATGLSLPYDFGDPESAMACAGALSEAAGMNGWVVVDPGYDAAYAIDILGAYGGEPWGAMEYGPREKRNEVPAVAP